MRIPRTLTVLLACLLVSWTPAHADDAERDAEVVHLQELVRLLREQVRHLRTEVSNLRRRVAALEGNGAGATPTPEPRDAEPSKPGGVVGTWVLDRDHLAKVLRVEVEETVLDMRELVGSEQRAALDALVAATVKAKADGIRMKLRVEDGLRATLERGARSPRKGTFARTGTTWTLTLDVEDTTKPRKLVFTPDQAGGLRVKLPGPNGRELRLRRVVGG